MLMGFLVQIAFAAVLCSSALASICLDSAITNCSACMNTCSSPQRTSCYQKDDTHCDCRCTDPTGSHNCFKPQTLLTGLLNMNMEFCRTNYTQCPSTGPVQGKYRICLMTNTADRNNCCNCYCLNDLNTMTECSLKCPNSNQQMVCLTDRAPYNDTITCQCVNKFERDNFTCSSSQGGCGYNYSCDTDTVPCAGCNDTPVYYDIIDLCTPAPSTLYPAWIEVAECMTTTDADKLIKNFCEYNIYDINQANCTAQSNGNVCEAGVDDGSYFAYCEYKSC